MKSTLTLIFIALSLTACSSFYKVKGLRLRGTAAQLRLPGQEADATVAEVPQSATADTLVVRDETGREFLIMKAVKDEASGEMVAADVLEAAVVSARFRHVAERGGYIGLCFQISVSDSLQDSRWQLRFTPEMHVLGDTVTLAPLYITGWGFRKAQLRGYQQYERFLRSIARDSAHFVDRAQLEIFLQRNLPQIYRFKSDTSRVSDEQFSSAFGVTGRQALEHYTNKLLIAANARKIRRKGLMRDKYIRNPIVAAGLRLDTVLRKEDGRFEYNYVHTLAIRPRLRKVDIVLKGAIHDENKLLYRIPDSPPLTFYVSSLSSFAQPGERYLTRVVERRAEANTRCNLDFERGSSRIEPALGDNAAELYRIHRVLSALLENETFDLDSVRVRASCSPEGTLSANEKLATRRSECVCRHLQDYIRHYRDSLRRVQGFSVDEQGRIIHAQDTPPIPLLASSIAEDWEGLSDAVQEDTLLSRGEKDRYRRLLDIPDADARERALGAESFYPYCKKSLYPRLRAVRLHFYLHRKGMVKDTVHTTVPDTVYREGLQALADHDYERAFALLKDYEDYNAAVAALALERHAYARGVLQHIPSSARTDYLLALIDAREGASEAAVQHYLDACRQDPSLVHRGNLDPEIAALVRRYGLNGLISE